MSDQVTGEFAAYSLAWAEEFDGPAGAPLTPDMAAGHRRAGVGGKLRIAVLHRRPRQRGTGWREPSCHHRPAPRSPASNGQGRRMPVHIREADEQEPEVLSLRAHSGQDEAPARPGNLARVLDARRQHRPGRLAPMRRDRRHGKLRHCPGEVHGTIHGPGYSGSGGITASLDTGSPLADGFHVYAVSWEPDRIRWYADQMLYHTVTPADLRGNTWAFGHDFYLLINVAVGRTSLRTPRQLGGLAASHTHRLHPRLHAVNCCTRLRSRRSPGSADDRQPARRRAGLF